MPDSMIYFGDALKALDDSGKIGGYLVRFSDDGKQKDLSGEYFTSKTFLGSREGDGVDAIFHHGQPIPVKATLNPEIAKEIEGLREHVFAPVKTKRDAIGIWAETVLNMADEYEKAVFGIVKAGKAGWSSGAVGHLVRKSADGQITRWPIGEASITPQPCEKLNRAIPIKAFGSLKFVSLIEGEDDEPQPVLEKQVGLAAKLNQHIDDLADDKGRTRETFIRSMAGEAGITGRNVTDILEGKAVPTEANLKAFSRILHVDYDVLKTANRRDHAQTIKGMFEELGASPSRQEIEVKYSTIIKNLAATKASAGLSGVTFDLEAKVAEATDEYAARLKSHALQEIETWISSSGDEEFYLKAILDAQASVKSLADATDLDTHSQFTVSVLRGINGRFRGNHEGRVKAGRVLSEKNRQRISDLMGQMDAVKAEFQRLLDESMPMASDAEKRAVLVKSLLRKQKQREMGVSL